MSVCPLVKESSKQFCSKSEGRKSERTKGTSRREPEPGQKKSELTGGKPLVRGDLASRSFKKKFP